MEQTLQIHFHFVTPRLRPFGERMIAKIDIVDLPDSQRSDPVVAGITDEVVFSFAKSLVAQGYGSFEKCLAVLTACNGDTNRAKVALQKVLNKEKRHTEGFSY